MMGRRNEYISFPGEVNVSILHIPLLVFLIVRLKFSNMFYEFLKRGSALKERAKHLEGTFSGFMSSP
ncbi:MAG: hypothetical protein ACE5GV_07575 [Candidatus Scalindua sp.]